MAITSGKSYAAIMLNLPGGIAFATDVMSSQPVANASRQAE